MTRVITIEVDGDRLSLGLTDIQWGGDYVRGAHLLLCHAVQLIDAMDPSDLTGEQRQNAAELRSMEQALAVMTGAREVAAVSASPNRRH